MKILNFNKSIFPLITGIAILMAISFSNLNAQCGMMMGGHGNHSGHDMKKMESADTTLIRKGIIDVEIIDVNNDGFVYQDQMDWNVISDQQGKCPICSMTLKEVTLQEAKENLKKNGFKFK